ncbi:MAG: hypothetical protein JOZ90_09675 [Alphaproteobacteria bacterium]|nr:hypothetical protein [Alphaproteobacteria bacterium]MBV9372985.1 hypothetical protein [Alphaproteobacteria bacterium]MBV9901352.1 hypothetical protein [Alphaproteobacteria bacterium]
MADSRLLPPRLAAILEDLPLHELAFVPVPVKARRDGWTTPRQQGFILRLALLGGVAAAARGVGKSRESAYRLRGHSGAASFAAAWDRAQGWGQSRASDIGTERAILGEVRGIYYRGRKVGVEVRHDNRLLMAAMRAMPEPPAIPYEEELAEYRRLLDALHPGRDPDAY